MRSSFGRRQISTILAPAILTASVVSVEAQTSTNGHLTSTNQAVFAPLDLPGSNEIRTQQGVPGPGNWQQSVSYTIRAALEPSRHRVTGSETISYTNNSPNELAFLWMQLDQNLFRPGSRGALIVAGTDEESPAFPGGGTDLHQITVAQGGGRYTPVTTVVGTRMRVDLREPLGTGGDRLDLEVEWSFTVPESGSDRMGRQEVNAGSIYAIAQWYPRMCVYDDVNGWNPMPYLGQGEFYLEYGDFEVEITAPRDFVVVAGGELINPEEVLAPEQHKRYEDAKGSPDKVAIIAREEVGTQESRPRGVGPLTWKYRLRFARDFAWGASNASVWDASGWNGVLLQALYPVEGIGNDENPGWERNVEYLRHTISFYSSAWFPYPYPSAVNVAGVVGDGMEYPGIVFCNLDARSQWLFYLTDHEFGHTWFPMVVGSDERRHSWMDEGFNTFINRYSNLDFYGPDAEQARRTSADVIAGRMQEPMADQPIATHADLVRGEGFGFLAYRKPAFGLILLREVILGEERFDKAFRTYINRWAFRHPMPWDFFRTMEDVSGEQLDWFWRGWIYGTDLLDQAVAGVESSGTSTVIHLENRNGLVMPVLLDVEMADGRLVHTQLPAEVWARSDSFDYHLQEKGAVVRVSLDAVHQLPDVDRSNNVWTHSPGR